MKNLTDKLSTVTLATNPGSNIAQDLVWLISGGGGDACHLGYCSTCSIWSAK